MPLLARQARFTLNIAKLINFANDNGYKVTFGEAFRPKETAKLYAEQGIGIVNSPHCERLAVDLNLFKDGKYLVNTFNHKPLGDYWKSLDKDNKWGGDFDRPDGNHYEMIHP